MTTQECCEFLRGKGFSKEYSTSQGYGYNFGNNYGGLEVQQSRGSFIGNITSMRIDIASTLRQVISPSNLVYDSDCAAVTIDQVSLSMTVSCKSVKNLATAFWGESTENMANLAPVVDQPIEVPTNGVYEACTFHSFGNPGVDPDSVTLTRTDTATDLEPGVDFVANEFGIEFLNGFTITPPDTINASYTYSSTTYKTVEPLTLAKKPLTITFIGRNAADMKPVMVTLHRVLLSPASTYALISDDFEDLELSGVLLADPRQLNGKSQYYSIVKI